VVADEVPRASGNFAAGAQIAGYRLAEQIGWGGMAVVYRARDVRLERWVALKILAPEIAGDGSFRRRFISESRAAAAVDHPHIIPVFEAGEAGGALFIAMRYVGGGDVRTLVRRLGPLDPARAGRIVGQVGAALDAAHAAGLVHRDVKPANMLLGVVAGGGHPDHVYLSDFGLSKQALAVAGLTQTGQFVGTLDYMAPEQIESRPVEGRTDQYALACAAFEMLSGEPPFHRGADLGLLFAQLSEAPPALTARRPDLPPEVDQVLVRALARSPAGRYPSCLEFAASLRAACGLEGGASGQLRPWPPRAAAEVAGAPGAGRPGQPPSAPAAPPYPARNLAAPGSHRHRPGPTAVETGSASAGRGPSGPWSPGQDQYRPGGHGRRSSRPDPAPPYLPPVSYAAPALAPPGRGRRALAIAAVACLVILGMAGAFTYLRQHGGASTRATGTSSPPGAAGRGGAARSSRPAGTVTAYIAAINRHNYTRAWKLGGRNSTSSFPAFEQGFATTAKDKVTIESVTGHVVTARLSARQTDGTVRTYQGTYTVDNGVITKFNVRRTG
jgi:serine/threonine protein kinase